MRTTSIESETGVTAYIELVDRTRALTGDKETDDLGYFFRLDKLRRVNIRTHLFDHLRGDSTGTDDMDPDPERLYFFGEHFGESDQGMLG